MNLQSFYVSWFDLFALVILMVGLRRGQKRGLSQEILYVLQWLTIVVAGGFLYEPVGHILADNSVFSRLFCYISAYLILTLVVILVFSFFRKGLGDKLVQSDAFGSGEYYLGMVAGLFRYACVLLVGLALLNARQFTKAELKAKTNYQKVNFGSVFFPSLADVQEEVFDRSQTGRFAQFYLSSILIKPTPVEDKKFNRGSVVRARERAIEQVLEKK